MTKGVNIPAAGKWKKKKKNQYSENVDRRKKYSKGGEVWGMVFKSTRVEYIYNIDSQINLEPPLVN